MRALRILTSMLVVLAAGCATKKPRFDSRAAAGSAETNFTKTVLTVPAGTNLMQPEARPFTLGPGDLVEIEVLGSAASRSTEIVGLDGKIYYQILPGLDVWGLTLSETRELLEKELTQYLNGPQVTVTLRAVGSKFVWLLGRLNKPGLYPVSSQMSLLECLAMAGGPSASAGFTTEDLADLRHSFLMRKGQMVPVDFYRLLHEGDMSQNIQLLPDDFVYVPSALGQQVYVLGSVHVQRAIVYTERTTLLSAIAAANGSVTFDYLGEYYGARVADAYLSHVAIVRGSLAEPQVAVVDFTAIMKGRAPDIRLEPGDIIYVPNSPYRTLKSYANMIVNAFVTTVAANEGVRVGGGTGTVGVAVPVGR